MIRILVVDDHAIFRAGLIRLLSDEPDIEVAGEADTVQDALVMSERAGSFDLMLLDISLKEKNGLEVLNEVKKHKNPSLPVLLLSMYPEDQYGIQAFRLGAAGYLTKGSEPGELLGAIRKVSAGGRYVSAALAEKLAAELSIGWQIPSYRRLSKREFQIFQALARGMTNIEISKELFLSPKTIATYRSRILEKFGMTRNAQLIVYAIENRLI